uniref:Secreted protein n=1 Tax=Ditylenchus dipsaci TaxID=166011 RepID=A0A915DDS1_9BILA
MIGLVLTLSAVLSSISISQARTTYHTSLHRPSCRQNLDCPYIQEGVSSKQLCKHHTCYKGIHDYCSAKPTKSALQICANESIHSAVCHMKKEQVVGTIHSQDLIQQIVVRSVVMNSHLNSTQQNHSIYTRNTVLSAIAHLTTAST